MPLEASVSLEQLAASTEGYSGAECAAVCREAALKAIQEDTEIQAVGWRHFEKALEEIQPRIPHELLELYQQFGQKR